MEEVLTNDINSMIKAISGWIGIVLSVVFFVSPLTLFIDLFKGKNKIKDIPLASIICDTLNSLLWFCFGLRLRELQMILCNIIGGVISLIWAMIYIVYYTNKNLFMIAFHTGWISLVISIIVYASHIIHNAEIIGYSAMIINVLMYAAPGMKMIEVIKTQKYTLIPISMSIIGLMSSLSWTCYGITIRKPSAIIPNALGIILSLIQISIWGYYYKNQSHHSVRSEPYKQAIEEMQQQQQPTS